MFKIVNSDIVKSEQTLSKTHHSKQYSTPQERIEHIHFRNPNASNEEKNYNVKNFCCK